jgi:NTE family protein
MSNLVPTLREQLADQRFGLVMSAGFFGFYGHAGFLKALFAAGLKPAAYGGTSAGGLVGSLAAAGATPDSICELLLRQRREHFWDPDPLGAVLDMARGGIGGTGLLKGERFRTLIDEALPVKTFEECSTPLVLVAADLSHGETRIFSSGALAPAVHATCAYPGLFRAARVGEEHFWDGGLVDKAPLLALAQSPAGKKLDAILVHYLPSRTQVNIGGPLAYAQAMTQAMGALRRDHFRLQLQVARAAGLKVFVVVSTLSPVSPTSMHKGEAAIAEAQASLRAALDSPPREEL